MLNALDSLESDNTQDNVTFTSDRTSRKRRLRRFHLSKSAVACIACFLVSGITVSAVGIVNAYRQRMEDMNQNTVEEYYELALTGETTELNRHYTEDERNRYAELNREYEDNNLFPESQIVYLQSADEYSGIALDTISRTLYLPQETLTDEELLEIIDFHQKQTYSIYKQNEERLINGTDWYSRVSRLSNEEVDEIYLAYCSSNLDVSGAHNRPMTESESSRYQALLKSYEEEGLYAASYITIIQMPEEYAGQGIAFCVADSTYYSPETEMTDANLLQYIDFDHKVSYCFDRIIQDIRMGFRSDYPQR